MSGQHVIFERNLAEMHSFLTFKASFLKEVSHKSFAFELQSFIFERSLARDFNEESEQGTSKRALLSRVERSYKVISGLNP